MVSENNEKHYTISELATFFGVSTITMGNWINEGRFIAKIDSMNIGESTLWKANNGQIIPIKEIVHDYEYKRQKLFQLSYEEEMEILKQEIKYFEDKYGGTLENTLLKRENKSGEELRDESEWTYLISRYIGR